jgi:hypothetical protein
MPLRAFNKALWSMLGKNKTKANVDWIQLAFLNKVGYQLHTDSTGGKGDAGRCLDVVTTWKSEQRYKRIERSQEMQEAENNEVEGYSD